jgi:eukaryotic-like serine/threonine-protein kinase
MAGDANDTGQFEIYVRPFPDADKGHWQVSTGGGTRPLWSRTGQELFYMSSTGALMAVRVDAKNTWGAGSPMKLFEGAYLHGALNYGRTYDVTSDGQRFLMIKKPQGTAATPSLIVVLNWSEELKRLVPAN